MVARVFEWYVQGWEGDHRQPAQRLGGCPIPPPIRPGRGPDTGAQGLPTMACGPRPRWPGCSKIPSTRVPWVQGRQRVVSYKVHQTMAVPPEDCVWWREPMSPLCPRPCSSGPRNWPSGRPAGRRGTRTLHLFAGFLRCADCGKSMSRKTARGIVYYTCSTYRRKSKTACTKHTIGRTGSGPRWPRRWGVQPEALSRRLLFEQVREIFGP